MENQDKPNFFAIIPAHVRYCKNLEMGARLLYGEITALASREGYCWASNQYFADLYEVEVRTIQLWLHALKKENFISVEIITEGLQTRRKIWISPEIQNIFAARNNFQGGVKFSEGGGVKNYTHINTTSNTEEKDLTVCPSGAVAPSGCKKKVEKSSTLGKAVAVEKDEIIRSAIQKNKDWSLTEIEEAWTILVNYSGKINDPWRFIEGTIEKIRQKKNFDKIKEKEEKPCKTLAKETRTETKTLSAEERALRMHHARTVLYPSLTS